MKGWQAVGRRSDHCSVALAQRLAAAAGFALRIDVEALTEASVCPQGVESAPATRRAHIDAELRQRPRS